MGEEWGCRQPFPFFCEFHDGLADQVREGRRCEFAKFPAFRDPKARARIPDPNALATFRQAVLDWSALPSDDARGWLALYRDLLHTRRKEIVPLLPRMRGAGTYQVQGARGLVAEWETADGPRLCLYANLGPEPLEDAPQPHQGRILAAVGEGMAESLASGRWPPWSVAWVLALGPAAS
jgi:1,4-alpha-glucan branching enzyme